MSFSLDQVKMESLLINKSISVVEDMEVLSVNFNKSTIFKQKMWSRQVLVLGNVK